MLKKILFLGVVVVVVVGLCSSVALALDPMGPPVAGLAQGQWSAGLDYSYTQMDLEFDGKFQDWYDGMTVWDATDLKFKLKNNEMHKAYLNLGYGITDKWEAFLRLGGANMYGKRDPMNIETYDYWAGHDETVFDSDTGFAIGFGTKATFWEDTNLKIGGLFQASWATVDYSIKYQGLTGSYYYEDGLFSVPTEGEMDFWEIQFAVGATYELSPRFTLYGGPFFHYFDGDYDYKGEGAFMGALWDMYGLSDYDYYYMTLKGDYDVEEESQFGGYLGAQIDVTDNVTCNAECQLTSNAVALGTNLTWRF